MQLLEQEGQFPAPPAFREIRPLLAVSPAAQFDQPSLKAGCGRLPHAAIGRWASSTAIQLHGINYAALKIKLPSVTRYSGRTTYTKG